ncbi:MAG: type IX secretion system membrane protein PorP/SprF [Marinoscillum sp.]|uniref:PorP/SprF family type IX secretion system membrane protein n=1 Tax=Marinoscillum sp. TaxID=2024838 RepID=UPI0032F1DD06
MNFLRTITIFALFFFFLNLTTRAQQRPMFTQYMFNGLVLNPAYAGSHESISATALSRIQWVGIDGAPVTHTFSIHSPIPDKNIALGAVFSCDRIGVTTQSTLNLSYAYRIQMRNAMLSMGLQGGLTSSKVNYDEIGANDPNLQYSGSALLPNFGLGLYLYGKRYYAGISVPTALKNSWAGEGDANNADGFSSVEVPHFFGTFGFLVDLSPLVKLKPSVLVKSVGGAPVEFDFNANLILDDKLWIGVSYRSFDALSLLLDIQLSPQLKLGYAYDYTLSELSQVTTGSHEIMLNYRFVFSKSKIVTPRYF